MGLERFNRLQQDACINIEMGTNFRQNIGPWKAFPREISVELSSVDL